MGHWRYARVLEFWEAGPTGKPSATPYLAATAAVVPVGVLAALMPSALVLPILSVALLAAGGLSRCSAGWPM